MGKSKLKAIGIVIGIIAITIIATGIYFYYSNKEDTGDEKEKNKPTPTATPLSTPTPTPTVTPEPTPFPVAPEMKQKKISDCTNCELEIDESIKELYNSIFPAYYDTSGAGNYFTSRNTTSMIGFGFIYHNTEKLLAKDMPNKVKMQLMIENIANIANSSDDYVDYQMEENKFIDFYHQFFGKTTEYTYEEFIAGCEHLVKTGNTLEIGNARCGDESVLRLFRYPYKAEKKNNDLYIYEKSAFQYDEEKKLYKDYKKTELIAENVERDELWMNIRENNTLGKYDDKVNIYKYTFKPNDDGTYYFYSVEKVK